MVIKAKFFNRLSKSGLSYVEGVLHNGVEYTGTDAVGKFVRSLDTSCTRVEIYNGDRVSIAFDLDQPVVVGASQNTSIRSEVCLSESKTRGFRWRKYSEMPLSVFGSDKVAATK